jgi:apolipoprotein D and lipocalin family protein
VGYTDDSKTEFCIGVAVPNLKQIFCTALLLTLAGCTGLPDGVESVDAVDPERYLGTWYEIVRLDHSFERGLTDVTATYGKREDGGISVVNRGYDADEGKWSQAEGRAYPLQEGDWSQLKVSFFGPFYGGYNIIALDDEYNWAMVVGPNRGYLWILARQPSLPEDVLTRLVAHADSLDFPTRDLIYVEHGKAP